MRMSGLQLLHFNTMDSASDISGNGRVDIYDLVLVGRDFGKLIE